MMPRSLTLLATAALLALLTRSVLAAEPEKYELHIGKKKVDVVEEKPFRIVLPGGVKLDAELRHPPRRWPGRVLHFTYPRDSSVDTTHPPGFLGWNVTALRRSRFVVRILAFAPGNSDPDKALASARRTVLKELGTGAEEQKEVVRREIAGEMRTGRRLVAMIGDDPVHEDVFAFRLGDRVFVLRFRWQEPTFEEDSIVHSMVATTLRRPAGGEKREPEPRFELHVGERTYPVDVDKPFDLVTAEGKTQSAVLRLAPKTFRAHGLSFVHPGDTTARLEDKPGRAMIHVSGGGYFASLQYFLVGGLSAEMAQATTVKFVKASVEETGAKFGRDKTCRFRFLGKSRAGTRMTTVGENAITIEIYTFEVGKRVLNVLFQYREWCKEEARATYKLLASTLKKE